MFLVVRFGPRFALKVFVKLALRRLRRAGPPIMCAFFRDSNDIAERLNVTCKNLREDRHLGSRCSRSRPCAAGRQLEETVSESSNSSRQASAISECSQVYTVFFTQFEVVCPVTHLKAFQRTILLNLLQTA